MKSQKRKNYEETHTDEINQKQARYNLRNRDQISQKNKRHYKENKPEIRTKQKEYYETNKDEILLKRNVRDQEKNNNIDAEKRLLAFKNEIKDGPTFVCLSYNIQSFLPTPFA